MAPGDRGLERNVTRNVQVLGETTHHNRPVQQHINQRLNNINVHRYYLVLGSFASERRRSSPARRRARARARPGAGAALTH